MNLKKINEDGFVKKYCVPYKNTATAYEYETNLLKKRARVTLHLTEKEKKLMLISISWKDGKDILDTVINIFETKYTPQKSSYSIKNGKKCVNKSYKIDKSNLSGILLTNSFLIVKYSNTPLISKSNKAKRLKKIPAFRKELLNDIEKF